MEILNKIDLRAKTVLKVFGLVFLGLILLALAFQFLGTTFYSITRQSVGGLSLSKGMAYDSAPMADYDGYEMGLSTRNVAPMEEGTSGADAEDYEVTQYSGTIETRHLDDTCYAISSLKVKDYVIFENANEYDQGCNYSFKVKKENKDEVLGIIESLDPKDLTENTQTIKRLIDDFTSEEEILNKKKETIEATLNDAINSYDEIARIATQSRDAESLAKIIDSKIRIIERLSEERININEQLDRLGRAKANQLDRLEYVYFYIGVYENKFIDNEQIKDSWKYELRSFVTDANKVIQNSSIGVIKILFYIVQFVIYLFILLFTAKFLWKATKKIWNR